MNLCAPVALSLQSTPTRRARPPSDPARAARPGASLRQGSHQLAQKLIAAGLPRRSAIVTRGGTSVCRGRGGAALAVPPPDPLRSSAATTAATATIATAAIANRRLIGALLRGEPRDVVDDHPGVEVRRVERRHLAAVVGAEDLGRVLDDVRRVRALRRVNDHVPSLPGLRELRLRADQVL